ncbi:MAG: phosphate ABC transporter substrate-binding protein [Bacilli bacterium]
MKKTKVILSVGAALAVTVGSLSFAGQEVKVGAAEKIVVTGSSALLPLVKVAEKDFKKINRTVQISVSGTSSINGPQSVERGVATIGACDWDASVAKMGFKGFTSLDSTAVARIPFAVVVNSSNDVKNLSSKQIEDIFTGKITNWKQVGGDDKAIKVVDRAKGSGTRVNFQEIILDKNEIKGDVSTASSGIMKSSVESDAGAIGYMDLAYVSGKSKAVSIDGVQATMDNAKSGKYKFVGKGYFLTKKDVSKANKDFIKYITSPKFQAKLKALKFLPVK